MRYNKLYNRKGRNGGCRSYRHAYILAELQFKREFFMTHLAMRRYWNDKHDPLYGPLELMTRWLRMKMPNISN